MPGIRASHPTGPGWKYSLDADVWQDSPVFTETAPGVPLVIGKKYTVYCFHQPTGEEATDTIICGQPSNDDTFQSLLERDPETDVRPIVPKILRKEADFVTQVQALIGTYFNPQLKVWDEVFIQVVDLMKAMQVLSMNFTDIEDGKLPVIRKLNNGSYEYFPRTLAELFSPAALSDAQIDALCARLTARGCYGGGSATPAVTLSFAHFEEVGTSQASGPPVLAGGYSGSMDVGACNVVSGWAANRNALTTPVPIDIYAGTTKVATVTADGDRSDVATALNSGSYDNFGWRWEVPASLRTGVAINFHAYIAGTQTELTFSPRLTEVCPPSVTVTTRFVPTVTITEGGLPAQITLRERLSDGSERQFAGAIVASTVDAPVGVTVNAQNAIVAGADSVTETQFVELHVAISSPVEAVYIGQAQIINTGCNRPSGLTQYRLNYAVVRNNQATAYTSLADACNQVGSVLDNSNPGFIGGTTFFGEAQNLSIGAKVYNGQKLDCELVSNEIYYVLDAQNGNTVKRAIRTENGIIVAILDSTYQTPSVAFTPDAGYVHSNVFDAALPNTYTSVGGTWGVSGGQLCQTDANAAQGRLVLNLPVADNANKVVAKLKIAQKGNLTGGVGVGLRYSEGSGYNLLFLGTGIQFLFDNVTLGPAFAFDWEAGVFYWFELKADEVAGKINLSGRIWKDGTARPTTWPYVWNGQPLRSGSAVLIGKALDRGPACVDAWYVYAPAPVTPPPATGPVLDEVAYYITSRTNSPANDGVGFYFKGSAITHYRFYIEGAYSGPTTPGITYELYSEVTNAATVSLTGNLARFNYRIVQSNASRDWEARNYSCKLEILSAGSVVQTVVFVVGVATDPSTNVPVTVFPAP